MNRPRITDVEDVALRLLLGLATIVGMVIVFGSILYAVLQL